MQRARDRSPVGSVFRLRFFLGFSLSRKTNFRKFGQIRPRLSHGHYTEWKGNKCHSFNSRRGLLKRPKNLYTIWGLNLIVPSEKGVPCSVLFTSYSLYRWRYCEKIYISRFILQGRNIIFKNILRVRCSLRKIRKHFMRIF